MNFVNLIRSPVIHTLVLQGCAQGLILVFSMIMARSVDIEVFGDFVFGFQFGQTASSVVALGATFCLAKFFARQAEKESGRLATFELQNRFLLRGGVALLLSWGAFALFARSWAATGSYGISIVNFAIVMLMAFFTAVGRAPLGNLLQAGRGLVLCVGALVAAYFLVDADPITVVLVASGTYIVGCYLYFGSRHSFGLSSDRSSNQFEFARQHVFSVILVGIDILILKVVAPADDVAIYGVALFLSNIASFALYAINANYTSQISRSLHSGGAVETQGLLRDVARINIALSLPFVVLLIAFAMNLTLFYGVEYQASEMIFFVLLAGQVVNVFVGSVALVANVSGYESTVSKYILQSLLMKLVFGAVAAFYMGALGMAVVASLANAIWNLRTFSLVLAKIGLNTTILKISKLG